MTKKTSTPAKPPGNDMLKWYNTTGTTARARNPSSSGRKVSRGNMGALPVVGIGSCARFG